MTHLVSAASPRFCPFPVSPSVPVDGPAAVSPSGPLGVLPAAKIGRGNSSVGPPSSVVCDSMRSSASLSNPGGAGLSSCRADVLPPWPGPADSGAARRETETTSAGETFPEAKPSAARDLPAILERSFDVAGDQFASSGVGDPAAHATCSGREDTSLTVSVVSSEEETSAFKVEESPEAGQFGTQRHESAGLKGTDAMGEENGLRPRAAGCGECVDERRPSPGSLGKDRSCIAAVATPANGQGGCAKNDQEATGREGMSDYVGQQNGGFEEPKTGRDGEQNDSRRCDTAEATSLGDCCSLCGQPRTVEGSQTAFQHDGSDANGSGKPHVEGHGSGAVDGEEDETWVCDICLRCAEEEAKTEEGLWEKEHDRSRVPQEPQSCAGTGPKDEGAASKASTSRACSALCEPAASPASHEAGSGTMGEGSEAEPAVASAAGASGKRRDTVPAGSGNAACGVRGDRSVVALPVARTSPVPIANPAKCVDEGTTRSTTVHIGPNHQVPALPAFFLDSSCWPRPPMDTVLDPSLTARLVYSPSALERIKLRREQEGRQDRAISSDADMTAFVKACSQNWKTRPGWQPFSPEFAYKILHYAGYDPVRALQIMNDPQFSFREVCDPPLRKYDNKWKPKDRRGLIAATPYPPPISARGSLARRHHREVAGYSLR
ncbi:hypothetical protein TGME49_275680 [Toxoplasma gondii ME49]|uniref:ELM2 domain-containing protein n=10 Tax=Toxoplasma gondii TaxID=5811 RepID=A0A125YID5_TOXGV|nr:hypothetical protein TGME49_275680 [Toxoplasma gondii ME49]EPR59222.1 hypothetical protein TGGT1_275680 [Toxoplasma gondii GT1]ESS30173.1 hypothetical protein TGVEG_275680 [Toxoplasma gondii VEG]KAF4645475.1 hypothetical protein TGRH88_005790 [Toxoplasma gondii]KFG29987.1 hypothetical protein TGDOM2_275680 [Toxoplasma gondii GAB2-2007-GAL-DOM2]KFG37216.1 hypothetical protein TGFOU_275680 [Toxoplasma gondii FOU]KFG47444.1 hypothetical protein TGP89_275680 [Toxoplasma gondii p89]KFG57967.1 |eukprot:XP_018638228.1 hypothetical protein TGME49_275680 [Toxoplasma gondii ME49]